MSNINDKLLLTFRAVEFSVDMGIFFFIYQYIFFTVSYAILSNKDRGLQGRLICGELSVTDMEVTVIGMGWLFKQKHALLTPFQYITSSLAQYTKLEERLP